MVHVLRNRVTEGTGTRETTDMFPVHPFMSLEKPG